MHTKCRAKALYVIAATPAQRLLLRLNNREGNKMNNEYALWTVTVLTLVGLAVIVLEMGIAH